MPNPPDATTGALPRLQAEARIHRLTERGDDGDAPRPVSAALRRAATGIWQIEAASFETDPIETERPRVSRSTLHLAEDADLLLDGPRLEVTLAFDVETTTVLPIIGEAVAQGACIVTLSNAADLRFEVPDDAGTMQPIVLPVEDYDAATGRFAVVGKARLDIGPFSWPLAMRIAGRFDPPI